MDDRNILRTLAGELAEISALPVQNQRRENWRAANDLNAAAPVNLLVYQEPWQEFSVQEALTCRCADDFLRSVELSMRKILFKWNHFQGDMIVDGCWKVPALINFDPLCGLPISEEILEQENHGDVVSHNYKTLFKDPDDLEKIKLVDIRYDAEQTERNRELLSGIFGDILPVKIQKIGPIWFAPWDIISMWYNPMELLMDLVLKPELMHGIISRYTDAMLHQLDQLEAQGLLCDYSSDHLTGSGGLAYSSALDETYDSLPCDRQWGSSAAQIFSQVSPEMHQEFALQYERKWLDRFGLTYYGCCEPLHDKLQLLKSVKNLRKISCSPWNNLEKTIEQTNGEYVLSLKLNPATVATPDFNLEPFRKEFTRTARMLKGIPCEIIFKDISTCHGDVNRITQWVNATKEILEKNR